MLSAATIMVAGDAIAQVPNAWSPTGSMGAARYNHSATLLADGRVLVAGGNLGSTVHASAEVYDPATAMWTATGSLSEARAWHTATLLPDGKVLVAGGYGSTYLVSTEVWDPATGDWSPNGALTNARYAHSATLLTNGRVLVVGGEAGGVAQSSAEVYDPSTDAWTLTGSMGTGRWQHTATLLADGQLLAAGGFGGQSSAGFFALVSAELYNPSTGSWSATGSLVRERSYHSATLLADGRVLAAAGAAVGALDSAEVYDPSTGTWALTGSLAARRWLHSAARLADGRVLIAGGFQNALPPHLLVSTASAAVYDPSSGTWSPTGSLATARTVHTMTALSDGRILTAGGYNRSSIFSTVSLTSAEVYNAAVVAPPSLSIDDVSAAEGNTGSTTVTFTVTLSAASLQAVMVDFATADGTAMAGSDYEAAGGTLTFSQGETTQTIDVTLSGDVLFEPSETFVVALSNAVNAIINDAEGTGTITNDEALPALSIDDVTVTESDLSSMATARSSHTATRLLDGRVVVTGGRTGIASAEVYDPGTGTWSPTGSLATGRWVHAATLLTDGRVLVAGGWNDANVFASAEVYDPSTGTWSPTGSMAQARWDSSATLLPDGKVLVAGGTVVVGGVTLTLASAEVYDPSTGSWSGTGSLATARANHMATRLLDGRVVVMGGRGDIASAEVYDPSTGTWSPAGSMSEARAGHTAALLPNGNVLVAGGFNHLGQLASAEVYDPTTNNWSPTGSMTAARYWFSFAWVLPNGRVLVTGSWGAGGHASAELYDPSTGIWSPTGSMSNGRGAHRTTLLLDGRVLVTGGHNSISGRLASAEVYSASTGTWSPAGALNAVFTVTLSPASAQTVTVDFATSDGTATAGSDYTAEARTLTFSPGETTVRAPVLLHGDIDVEPDETLFVSLSNATNATIADSEGTGTIANNDVPSSLMSIHTPVGSDVSVSLPPVRVTFDSVTQAGQTDGTISVAGPPPPAGFQLGDPPTYIDLSTTAVFAGSVEVCIDYTGFPFSDETLMRLFHFVNAMWTDITTSLDTIDDVICGVTTSLSPFAVLEPANTLAPVLKLPADIKTEATSAAGALVGFVATAIHEIEGPVPVACSSLPDTTFALGATRVNCSASDAVGNTATSSFVVTVADTTAPTLTAPANITAPATSIAGAAVSFVTSALDLVDGTVAVICAPSSGSIFPVGATTVICGAGDTRGNQTTRTFTVSVTVGAPRLSARVLGTMPRTAASDVTVTLQISNLGDGSALDIVVDRMTLRALTGSGTLLPVTALPIEVGTITVGQSRMITITVNAPTTVSRFSMTAAGHYVRPSGVAYAFSMTQPVTP
jgi:uncharacterized delta-60 repeat protein